MDQFHRDEGIRLDRNSIGYNAAKRGLAKLCLNSMWEKLTEKQQDADGVNLATCRTVQIPITPGVEVQNMLFANDDVVWISWQNSADERVPSLRHTNEVICAYVTAGARIHLYSFLERLQEKAIYTDTDSVIFIQPGREKTYTNRDR